MGRLPIHLSADAAAVRSTTRSTTLRVALLHLAPIPGAVAHNRQLVESAITQAAALGAAWIVTPECCLTGYQFAAQIGTAWIAAQLDPWLTRMCALAARLRVTLFLSLPERDAQTAACHNSVFVVTPDGMIAGSHRKINVVLPSAEAWSTPGERAVPVAVQAIKAGLLICADACSPGIVRSLRARGAQILVSAAAWAPGEYGPAGEWERCSRESDLPLIVCNRTGPDRTLSFAAAESVVVQNGARLLAFHAERSTIFTVDWDRTARTFSPQEHQPVSPGR